jgi:hypothetical protein
VPVAVETFECEYLGDQITVEAGEWCIDGHELAARFPGSFRRDPLVDKKPGPRVRSTPPPRHGSAARGTSGAPPERYRVEFTRYARHELDLALNEYDGSEVGGGLFGAVTGDTIVIETVGFQAPDRDRTSGHTELSSWGCAEQARTSGTTWIGDWHVHCDRGAGSPSDVDQRGWQACRTGGRPWCGLIITPGPDPVWAMCDPVIHPWVVTDQGLKSATLIT